MVFIYKSYSCTGVGVKLVIVGTLAEGTFQIPTHTHVVVVVEVVISEKAL